MANTSGRPRIGVASIIQETNTFSPCPSTMEDFQANGLWLGAEAADRMRGTNTEFAGAMRALTEAGVEAVPLMHGWAMSAGTLTRSAFNSLGDLLEHALRAAGSLDGLVLCLHGALVAEHEPEADAALTELARRLLGSDAPLVVTHDLHANVTKRVVSAANAVIGFRTYPHVDQADTGGRGAALVLRQVRGEPPARTALAKRAMIVPPEAQSLAEQPMVALRARADAAVGAEVLDISLFPVQPWLDIPELGFGVTVTSTGNPHEAAALAEQIADAAWQARARFRVELHEVDAALSQVTRGPRPALLVQSADSPTAGATADNAVVVGALLRRGRGLRAYATVVDGPAVAQCHELGAGATLQTTLGSTLDSRWADPVPIVGQVLRIGDTPVVLAGATMTGQVISMGRWATLDTGDGLVVLVTERPAPTFDPSGYRHVGLDPAAADAVLIRSATLYRAGFADITTRAFVLDLPGASTPRFDYLDYHRAPRPLYPLDNAQSSPTEGQVPAPVELPANYVPVYYAGGRNIEQFRDTGEPATSPEDWVGSLSALPQALLPAYAGPQTGVSPTEYGSMRELVAADPEGWLGHRLADAYAGQSGLLVKLLDAGERLPVHCHPTRDFARAHLGSVFGKTEGWFVMHAEPGACVWIGMREAVDEADMRRWISTADVSAMLTAMNRVPVRPGQVVYVPAGLPHAIGPGVMVTELQEPTSFSVLADHAAFGVDEQAATLGLGWELAVSCFDLTAHGDRLDRLLPIPRPLPGARPAGESRLLDLFPAEAAEFFRAWRADCAGQLALSELGFALLVVIDGRGRLEWDGGHRTLRRGQTLAVPAAAGALRLVGDVSVIACLPPKV